MNVETVSEEQGIARRQMWGYRLVVDRAHGLIGNEHHDHIGPLRGGARAHYGKSLRLCLGSTGRPVTEANNHVYTRIPQVERVGVPLAAVANDGYLLRLNE